MSRGSPELEWAVVGFWPAMGLCRMLYRQGMDGMSTRSIWGLSLIGEEEESATALGSLRRPAMWHGAVGVACAGKGSRGGTRAAGGASDAWRQCRIVGRRGRPAARQTNGDGGAPVLQREKQRGRRRRMVLKFPKISGTKL